MKKGNILICDDERGVRESLKVLLEKEYDLSFASDGAEAIQHVQKNNPDVAILDIKMPNVNGLVALRKIKELKPNVRVVIITGYESTDVAAEAINAGADDYLNKPFDGERIKAQIKTLLESKRA